MMIVERKKYLDLLIAGQGNGLVKIVTGGRRCGKSFLLFNIFTRYLTANGVDASLIIGISLDEWRNRHLLDPDALLDYIDAHIHNDGKTHYVILDEVQLLEHFVGVAMKSGFGRSRLQSITTQWVVNAPWRGMISS